MKTSIFLLAFILTLNISAQVGIGTTNPVSSAQLDVVSTTSGVLLPRMTQDQRDAIINPIAGLMIWCNNCVAPAGELQVYNGEKWTNMIGGTSPSGTTTICGMICDVKNLNVDRYRNGDPIPKVSNNSVWDTLTTGAYCYFNNDSATYAATYGKLYNWFALNDPRGLAPEGWHIPSDDEWTAIATCLGGGAIAGGPMKEAGYAHWSPPNAGATNSSGFTGLPGNNRSGSGGFITPFLQGYWWSSTPTGSAAYYRDLNYFNDDLHSGTLNKQSGLSVRCFRD
ncbi:MAG: fibrobacter succinogenes major paralogous domain-containing protein [Saprospiraceae bacterium]